MAVLLRQTGKTNMTKNCDKIVKCLKNKNVYDIAHPYLELTGFVTALAQTALKSFSKFSFVWKYYQVCKQSNHLYLYSAFNNTNCNKALHNIKIGTFCQCKMTGFNTQLSAECISLLNLVMALSSLNNICAIKSMIVLQVKCPQLSKPEATAARNENSIGDRMEKKSWEKPGSVGGPVPLRPDKSIVCSNCSKVSVSGPLVPGVFPRWMSR